MTECSDSSGTVAAGKPPRTLPREGVWSPSHAIPHDAPRAARPGAFLHARAARMRGPRSKEVSMFEGQPQAELDALFKANPEFRQLYHHHKELDKKVLDAELGVLPIDDTTLARMKREKLAAKDRLSVMYQALAH